MFHVEQQGHNDFEFHVEPVNVDASESQLLYD